MLWSYQGVILKTTLLAATAALFAIPAAAQVATPMPVQRADSAPSGNAILPANTEVILETSQEITTKGKTWSEGDQFKLAVVDDVMLGEYVVIPKGTPAYGRITWLTSKGAFGKSGKMDIELEHLELSGRRIKLDGTYRQEGEGNTLATVGGVIAAGIFAGFITGKSGRIPQGRELTATLEDPIELAIPASAVFQSRAVAPMASRASATVATSVAEANGTLRVEQEEVAEASDAESSGTTPKTVFVSEPIEQETGE